MLGSRLSIALSGLIFKTLPSSMACTVVRRLGLCMPASPAALALVLGQLTVGIMKGLEKEAASLSDIKAPDEAQAKATFLEIFAALYCLAVMVMARNADGIWSLDKPVFQWYTAKTFDLSRNTLLQEALKEGGAVRFDELVDECTELYLHDRPTLGEFGEQMADYILNVTEVQPAIAKSNWALTFGLKAKTRILWRLGVNKTQLGHFPLTVLLGRRLLDAREVFEQLRPAFDEKTAEGEGG